MVLYGTVRLGTVPRYFDATSRVTKLPTGRRPFAPAPPAADTATAAAAENFSMQLMLCQPIFVPRVESCQMHSWIRQNEPRKILSAFYARFLRE